MPECINGAPLVPRAQSHCASPRAVRRARQPAVGGRGRPKSCETLGGYSVSHDFAAAAYVTPELAAAAADAGHNSAAAASKLAAARRWTDRAAASAAHNSAAAAAAAPGNACGLRAAAVTDAATATARVAELAAAELTAQGYAAAHSSAAAAAAAPGNAWAATVTDAATASNVRVVELAAAELTALQLRAVAELTALSLALAASRPAPSRSAGGGEGDGTRWHTDTLLEAKIANATGTSDLGEYAAGGQPTSPTTSPPPLAPPLAPPQAAPKSRRRRGSRGVHHRSALPPQSLLPPQPPPPQPRQPLRVVSPGWSPQLRADDGDSGDEQRESGGGGDGGGAGGKVGGVFASPGVLSVVDGYHPRLLLRPTVESGDRGRAAAGDVRPEAELQGGRNYVGYSGTPRKPSPKLVGASLGLGLGSGTNP